MMNFLPDMYVPCEVCKGQRYNRETLEVQYKGKNISQVLDMTAEEAVDFFENLPKIRRKAQTLVEVGLGYVKLGQSSTTLSGGEAQRVKLATELSRTSTGKTIYILDEPTTGLHTDDVGKLLEVRDGNIAFLHLDGFDLHGVIRAAKHDFLAGRSVNQFHGRNLVLPISRHAQLTNGPEILRVHRVADRVCHLTQNQRMRVRV